jgi:hypothetical protein
MDWSTQAGWYLPFPATDEMSLANPVRLLQVLVVTSMASPAPKANASDPDPCFQSPRAWLNVVDPVTGLTSNSVLGTVTITLNGNLLTLPLGSTPVRDIKYTFGSDKTPRNAQGGPTRPPGEDCVRAVGATSDKTLCGDQNRGRTQWREIPGLRTRGN